MSLQSLKFLQWLPKVQTLSEPPSLSPPAPSHTAFPSLPGVRAPSSISSLDMPSSLSPQAVLTLLPQSIPPLPPLSSHLILQTHQLKCQSFAEVSPAPSIEIRSFRYDFL